MITMKQIEEMVKVAEEEGMAGLEKLIPDWSVLSKAEKQKLLNTPCGDFNALQLAISQKKLKAVNVLLEAGASVESVSKSWYDKSPLQLAVEHGLEAAIQPLVDHGADINKFQYINERWVTVLETSIVKQNITCMHSLLKAGANADLSYRSHYHEEPSPLMIAVETGNIEIVQMLIDAKADLQKTNTEGETALHVAAKLGFVEGVRALLNAGANINTQSKDGKTPLRIVAGQIMLNSDTATYEKHLEIFVLLLNQKNIDLKIHSQGSEALRLLSGKNGAALHALALTGEQWMTSKDRKQAISLAIEYHNIDMLNIMLKITKDMKEIDEEGRTMHLAVTSNFPAGILALRRAGLSVDIQYKKEMNHTPLMIASLMGNLAALQALIEAKADLELQNKVGNTALHLAAQQGFVEGIHALLAAGANINALNRKEHTPIMHGTADYSQLGSTQALVERGAQLQVRPVPYEIYIREEILYVLMRSNVKLPLERITSKDSKLIVKFHESLAPFLQKGYLDFLAFKLENEYLDKTKDYSFNVGKVESYIDSEAKMACDFLFGNLERDTKTLKDNVKDFEELEKLKTISIKLLKEHLKNFYFKQNFEYVGERMFPISKYRGNDRDDYYVDPVWHPYQQIMMFEDWCETSGLNILAAPLVSLVKEYLCYTPVSGFSEKENSPYTQQKANEAAFELRKKLVNLMKENKKTIMRESRRLTAKRRTVDTIPGSEDLIARFRHLTSSQASASEPSTALLRFSAAGSAGSASGSAASIGSSKASAAMDLGNDDDLSFTALGVAGASSAGSSSGSSAIADSHAQPFKYKRLDIAGRDRQTASQPGTTVAYAKSLNKF